MAIITKDIEYHINNESFTGYLAYDDRFDKKNPGIILVHEWWGHDEFVRAKAERLASEGFVAFALDMYGTGVKADGPDQAGELMAKVTSTEGLVEQRFMAAYDVLCAQQQVDSTNINAAGYCFGGEVVLEMARAGKTLNAVASFHGLLETKNPMQANTFNGTVLAYNGVDDPLAPTEIVEKFTQEMRSADVCYDIVNYPGVMHAFTNPASAWRSEKYGIPILKYDEQADEDSHQQMVAAFARKK